jgi:type I restriction enzyme S subunit
MSNWVADSLNQLVAFQKGRKVETSAFQAQGYERYLGAGALSGKDDGYASKFLAVMANKQDVLMLWDGERSGLVGQNLDGVVSSTVCKLTPNGKINSTFLYYLLLLNFDWIQNRRTGTGVPHVPKDIGRILKLGYPADINLQRKITLILGAIDQTIEKTETLIEKYQQIKAGLMHDLFTRGIGADGKLRPPHEQAPELYQQTPIGWIPKEWNICSLTSIASYQHGRPFPSTDYSNEGIFLLRPGNLHISGYVLFDDAHSTRIPESWKNFAPGYIVTKGDILMNLTAQSLDDEFLGRVCLYEDTEYSLLNQRIARFKALTVEHEFLYWILRSKQFRKQIDNTSQGTKVQHLYNRDLNRVKLGIPNKSEEQVGIALRLNKASEKIRAEIDSLQKLKQQKFGLMHDLLTGKVQVNIEQVQAEVSHV